jgi:hypothetical protein
LVELPFETTGKKFWLGARALSRCRGIVSSVQHLPRSRPFLRLLISGWNYIEGTMSEKKLEKKRKAYLGTDGQPPKRQKNESAGSIIKVTYLPDAETARPIIGE